MMHHGNWCPPVEPIVCPPEFRCHDVFMPREVPVIHPIVNVNRHHCVDIPKHYFTETTKDVMGAPVYGGEYGPRFGGGYGPGFGGFGRRRW